MPAKPAPACVLDKTTQFAVLEILDALAEETEIVEIDGEEHSIAELRAKIAACSNTPGERPPKGQRKRGPREPSAYNLFISECRRAPEKGGRGLDFNACVAEWNKQKG
jgi:hypothetical protein